MCAGSLLAGSADIRDEPSHSISNFQFSHLRERVAAAITARNKTSGKKTDEIKFYSTEHSGAKQLNAAYPAKTLADNAASAQPPLKENTKNISQSSALYTARFKRKKRRKNSTWSKEEEKKESYFILFWKDGAKKGNANYRYRSAIPLLWYIIILLSISRGVLAVETLFFFCVVFLSTAFSCGLITRESFEAAYSTSIHPSSDCEKIDTNVHTHTRKIDENWLNHASSNRRFPSGWEKNNWMAMRCVLQMGGKERKTRSPWHPKGNNLK